MNCATCIYWSKVDEPFSDGGGDEGECRRYAPQMLSGVGAGYSDQLHPKTKQNHWCGEYRSPYSDKEQTP